MAVGDGHGIVIHAGTHQARVPERNHVCPALHASNAMFGTKASNSTLRRVVLLKRFETDRSRQWPRHDVPCRGPVAALLFQVAIEGVPARESSNTIISTATWAQNWARKCK